MADHSKIEWTDSTWTPIRARNRETGKAGHFCVRVSDGCRNCYAERMQPRFGNPVRYAAQDAEKVELFLDEKVLMEPLRWRKPRMVFACSMTDLFLEAVPDEWIDRVFAVMALAPQHRFQALTKRAERMREYLTRPVQGPWAGRAHAVDDDGAVHDMTDARFRMFKTVPDLLPKCPPGALTRASEWQDKHYPEGDGFVRAWPLPNVWLGVSAEDQRRAEERIPILLDTPAAVRFLSAEPLLGPINLTRLELVPDRLDKDGELRRAGIRVDALRNKHCESGVPRGLGPLDQVIVGGESGNGARPMHPDWARGLRDQCEAAGVSFFFKQWGQWSWTEDLNFEDAVYLGPSAPYQHHSCGRTAFRVGKKRAGRLLDGREWNEVPA